MSAVGFDFRNERCVVAVAKNTGIVCFEEEQRFLGIVDASPPKIYIPQIMRLIGRPFSDLDLKQDLKALPFSVTEGPDGFPLIHARYRSEKRSFTPTEVMGIVFSNMKKLAEKNLNADVVDCCIGIPVYFTDLQRRALMDAAKISGLNPLRLMHETTATALAYGLYKPDLCENKQLNVAFVDIGHASMQVCIAGFKKGQVTILAHSFDRCLGGRDFDEVLFQHFADKFEADYKIDVFQNPYACIVLHAACENLKEVLRSNPEASLYVECLIDREYVRGFIKRDEFECTLLLERIKNPLEKALLEANLTLDECGNLLIEVVSSDSWVSNILTDFFGKKSRSTMNASECVSRGCALECAILSPNFKVRDFQVQDIFPFSIALQSKGFNSIHESIYGKTEDLQSCIVFPRGNPFPSVETRYSYTSGTISMDVQYGHASELQTPATISTFMIGSLPSANGKLNKLKMEVGLNLHGCVYVNSAHAQVFGETGIGVSVPVSRVEPLKGTTETDTKKGLLTDVEVYECLTLPKT